MLCKKCYGSGRIMGNGMIYEKCNCDQVIDEKKPVAIDKRSKSYRDAIEKLMVTNDIDRDEAAKVFESEFNKIV